MYRLTRIASWLAAGMLLLTGCTTTQEGLALLPVEYEFVDKPAEGRIVLSYVNPHSFAVCLLPETFPAENGGGFAGRNSGGREVMKLIVADTDYYPVWGDFEYCFGGCVRRVEPGQTITGAVSYSAFSLPRDFYTEPKELDFKTVTYACDGQG